MTLHLRRLLCDRRGASALEFALVAPIMLFLILGLIQLGMLLFATHVLNESLAVGARALYFDMADRNGAMAAAREAAGNNFLSTTLLELSVTQVSTPYPALRLEAVYPFTGIGLGLPGGSFDIHASTSVAIVD